ncbi:MAG: DMT family transporter [Pseudomonadota bacterium]
MSAAGVAAALITVLCWAGFLLSLRFGIAGDYNQGSLVLMRFLPGFLLLAPIWWRLGFLPAGVRPLHVVIIALGSGPFFFLLMSGGLAFAPASDAGALGPGFLPLLVALTSLIVLKERFSRLRVLGFLAILTGGLTIGGWEALTGWEDGRWQGHLLIISAVTTWAFYTVAFRLSGLTPLEAAALTMLWAAPVLLPLAWILGASIGSASFAAVASMTFVQGVLTGLLALLSYGQAVKLLGASRTAAFTALTPVLVLLGGYSLLGEQLDGVNIAGILIVSAGVFLASGFLDESI